MDGEGCCAVVSALQPLPPTLSNRGRLPVSHATPPAPSHRWPIRWRRPPPGAESALLSAPPGGGVQGGVHLFPAPRRWGQSGGGASLAGRSTEEPASSLCLGEAGLLCRETPSPPCTRAWALSSRPEGAFLGRERGGRKTRKGKGPPRRWDGAGALTSVPGHAAFPQWGRGLNLQLLWRVVGGVVEGQSVGNEAGWSAGQEVAAEGAWL